MSSVNDEFKPVQKLDISINGDNLHDFARKHNAEIENIYEIMNALAKRINNLEEEKNASD